MLSPFLKPGEQGSNTLAGFLTPLYTNRPSQNISGRMSFFCVHREGYSSRSVSDLHRIPF